MKAIVCTKYGPPEVLQYQDVEMPQPGENEVLVKVMASSVNFGDRALVNGKPFLVRLMGYGLMKPKNPIPGGDIAGIVEAVGRNINSFQVGDAVFGDIGDKGFGAFAEYVCVPENSIVKKPDNVTFEEAASVCQASIVALQGLRDKGKIQSGQTVLVNGASGGVGTFAVQIAKAYGAEVTGVCSTGNLENVRSIGADHVIDYTREDFTKKEHRYDLIFDIVANRPISEYMGVLSPKGTYVACAFNPAALFFGTFISKREGKQASALSHKPNRQDLFYMQNLLANGSVKPVIDRSYPLSAVPEAMRYLQDSGHFGKVVINHS